MMIDTIILPLSIAQKKKIKVSEPLACMVYSCRYVIDIIIGP